MFISLHYRFSDYYFVCAVGGQHDVHLPFWSPGFVKLIMLLLHVLFVVAEINILLLLLILLMLLRDIIIQIKPHSYYNVNEP